MMAVEFNLFRFTYNVPSEIWRRFLIVNLLAVLYIRLAGIYLLKVTNRNFRTRCEICSKLTIKISERGHWRRSGVLLLILNMFHALF